MKTLGQIAYEGYYRGNPSAKWEDATNTIQRDHWEAAAQAVIEAHAANPKQPARLLEIENCSDCIYLSGADECWDFWHCFHPEVEHKIIGEARGKAAKSIPIPDWCPLPKKETSNA